MGTCASSNTQGTLVGLGQGPREVHVTLNRDGTIPLGLRLTRDRHGIITRGIDEGSAQERWNTQHPGMEVGRGDRILSVNDVPVDCTWSGWCDILAEFRKHTVTVVVARNLSRPRRQGPLEPSVALDHLLPDGFLDGLPRNLKGACNRGDECAICLEALEDGSDAVVLPCKHAFHHGCAERWLTQCPTYRYARCPTCRTQIPFDIGMKCAEGVEDAATPDDNTRTEGISDSRCPEGACPQESPSAVVAARNRRVSL